MHARKLECTGDYRPRLFARHGTHGSEALVLENARERVADATTCILERVLQGCRRRAYQVLPGDTFSDAVFNATGRQDPLMLEMVQAMNPHIANPDHIEPFWVIYLPEPPEARRPEDHGNLTPAVRRLVHEHHLDPARIEGTGKDGRILKGDVLRHLEAGQTPSTSAAPTQVPTAAAKAAPQMPPVATAAPPPAAGERRPAARQGPRQGQERALCVGTRLGR